MQDLTSDQRKLLVQAMVQALTGFAKMTNAIEVLADEATAILKKDRKFDK